MPAFWVSPNTSPLGASRSISAVSGRLPAGPAPTVRTSCTEGSDSTIRSKPSADVRTSVPLGLIVVASLSHTPWAHGNARVTMGAGTRASPRPPLTPTPAPDAHARP